MSDNFFVDGGIRMHVLDKLSRELPIVMHGVSLSIGSCDAVDMVYLEKIKQLAKRCNAQLISDHVCWTGVHGQVSHDLLPVPYSEACLKLMVKKIKQVQDFLERPLVLENPSSYLEFTSSTLSEWDFIAAMCKESSCQLLLDVNNVYVSSKNHNFDAETYIRALDPKSVVQYHLAGHSDMGTHLLDTHIGPLPDPVLDLYRKTLTIIGPRSTLIEWDEDVPSLGVLVGECQKVKAIQQESPARAYKLSAPKEWERPCRT